MSFFYLKNSFVFYKWIQNTIFPLLKKSAAAYRNYIILNTQCYTSLDKSAWLLILFYNFWSHRALTGSKPFAPISRIAFMPSSSGPVSRARCFDLFSSSSFILLLFMSPLFLSLSISFFACLRSTKMRSCPPTTPSRRTACVDLVAGPLRPPPPLSHPAVGEKERKNEGRDARFHGLPGRGCTLDARWRLRVLGSGFLIVTLVK